MEDPVIEWRFGFSFWTETLYDIEFKRLPGGADLYIGFLCFFVGCEMQWSDFDELSF